MISESGIWHRADLCRKPEPTGSNFTPTQRRGTPIVIGGLPFSTPYERPRCASFDAPR